MKIERTHNKIIVVCGPTATGKSDLAVLIARRFGGEVISADSRQVYKGLDIGTGKITKPEMKGVAHHLLDICSPKKVFSVADFQKLALEKIEDIISRGRVPIICGGTGFYIDSLINESALPDVPPDPVLRKKLSKYDAPKLLRVLQKLDKKRARDIDPNNKVRLIRAIEIATKIGNVPRLNRPQSKFDVLHIGLTLPKNNLRKKIETRLLKRLPGMIKEAARLHSGGLSWKRMRELGLEYRYLAKLLCREISKDEFVLKLNTEIWHYAKRQMTWFGRNKNIKWFAPSHMRKIMKLVSEFMK